MHATLTINVRYDAEANRENVDLVRQLLDQAANHLAEGFLTGKTDLVVDGWSCDVEVKP